MVKEVWLTRERALGEEEGDNGTGIRRTPRKPKHPCQSIIAIKTKFLGVTGGGPNSSVSFPKKNRRGYAVAPNVILCKQQGTPIPLKRWSGSRTPERHSF